MIGANDGTALYTVQSWFVGLADETQNRNSLEVQQSIRSTGSVVGPIGFTFGGGDGNPFVTEVLAIPSGAQVHASYQSMAAASHRARSFVSPLKSASPRTKVGCPLAVPSSTGTYVRG